MKADIIVSMLQNAIEALYKTRCKPKPDCSPPGYPPRLLLITVNWSVGSPASIESINLPVPTSVQQLHSQTFY